MREQKRKEKRVENETNGTEREANRQVPARIRHCGLGTSLTVFLLSDPCTGGGGHVVLYSTDLNT